MTVATSRRDFLRGGFRDSGAMRPLGAIPAMQFAELCTGCGDCARACPESLIRRDEEGFPVVSLRRGECTFCNACTDACETGALEAGRPWTWRASVSDTCLSLKGVQCRSCQDHCDAQAIRFQLQPGGRAQPHFDSALCTGCGACAAPCPVNAIEFTQLSQATEACPC